MKLSKYETLLSLINSDGIASGEFALINGLYGAVDMISPDEANIISRAMNDPSMLESLNPSRITLLAERGHITLNEAREDEDLRIISRLNTMLQKRNGVGIVLLPTYNCNFRCTYCYERHRLERGNEWLERSMSRKLVDAIFSQLRNYKQRGFILTSCTLFGGEPLLAGNEELIRYICGKCRELNMSVSAITNGYYLDKFIDIITEYKFTSLQITIDGTEDVHNRMRPLAGGGKSYAKIMENVKLALEHDVRISIRVNVNRTNLSGIRAFIDELKSTGLTEYKNFSFYFKSAFEYYMPSGKNIVRDSEIVNELVRTGSSYMGAVRLESAYSSVAAKIAGWLNKRAWPSMNTTFCGAEGGMNVIDANGLIYPCWNIVARDDKAIGFVEDDADDGRFMYDFSMSKWRTRTVDRMHPCRTCPVLMLCGGGCAAENSDNLNEGTCEDFKEIYAEVAPRLIWKVRHERLNFDDSAAKEADKPDNVNISESLKVRSKFADYDECLSLSLREVLSEFTADERKVLMSTNNERDVFDILKAHEFFASSTSLSSINISSNFIGRPK